MLPDITQQHIMGIAGNMASHSSPLIPEGLVPATCILHSCLLRKVGSGKEKGTGSFLVFREQWMTPSLSDPKSPLPGSYCHTVPGQASYAKPRVDAPELLALKRNALRASWERSRTYPPWSPTRQICVFEGCIQNCPCFPVLFCV